ANSSSNASSVMIPLFLPWLTDIFVESHGAARGSRRRDGRLSPPALFTPRLEILAECGLSFAAAARRNGVAVVALAVHTGRTALARRIVAGVIIVPAEGMHDGRDDEACRDGNDRFKDRHSPNLLLVSLVLLRLCPTTHRPTASAVKWQETRFRPPLSRTRG